MTTKDSIFDLYAQAYESQKQHRMSLREYLEGCRADPTMYASAAERMLKAIGEPDMVDTAKDPRLGRIFMNRTIKVYPAFEDFYGMEETIERIVGFFRHAAQGLEERKQILYLLGPVGGGKSSLAERLKLLMEKEPDLCAQGRRRDQPDLREPARPVRPDTMGRARGALRHPAAAADRHDFALGGQAARRIRRRHHEVHRGRCTRRAAADLRRQDRAGRREQPGRLGLVGKVDIRKLEMFSQNDPDAYSFSGGLNRTTQGMLEFVEMFKAPIKMLHPLLDRDAGGQLRRHREHRRHPVSGHHPGALERGRVADLQEQQEQRSLHRPHLGHQGAVLPARHRGEARSTKSCCRAASCRARPARPARWTCCRGSACCRA